MRLHPKFVRIFWIAWALTMVLGGVALYLINTPLVHVTQDRCNAIRPGMSLSEVQAIIGGPPRWYDGVMSHGPKGLFDKDAIKKLNWVSKDGQIVLDLSPNGGVAAAKFYSIQIGDQSWEDFYWQRLTRGHRDEVVGSIIFVLIAGAIFIAWRCKLIGVGYGPVALSGIEQCGLWFNVASWKFVCVLGCPFRVKTSSANAPP